jgi:hypothetical protein
VELVLRDNGIDAIEVVDTYQGHSGAQKKVIVGHRYVVAPVIPGYSVNGDGDGKTTNCRTTP